MLTQLSSADAGFIVKVLCGIIFTLVTTIVAVSKLYVARIIAENTDLRARVAVGGQVADAIEKVAETGEQTLGIVREIRTIMELSYRLGPLAPGVAVGATVPLKPPEKEGAV